MKTKAILATILVNLALLAGCNKAEGPAATKAPESAPSTAAESPATATPAPAAETPAAATPAPAEAPAAEGK
jgi:hypothetical protein